MFESRIYRAALVPFAIALLVAAFSLTDRRRAPASTLAPDAFDGAAAAQLQTRLATAFPDRRPGSAGDTALADAVRGALEGPNFSVLRRTFAAQTVDGERDLQTVTAKRAGASPRQIVLLAHRDALGRGAAAELSGTAALLELAHVLAGRVTNHTVTFVSTSGGAGGAGAADFAAHAGPVDAVLVLGDMASASATRRGSRRPRVIGFSDTGGTAPPALTRAAADAVAAQTGHSAGSTSAWEQFARLALPLTVGEQGRIVARGIPAVLIQASGERGPAPSDAVDPQILQSYGRAALATFNALDASPNLHAAPDRSIDFGRLSLPAWPVRLLVGLLLLAPLASSIDAFARARRRGHAFGRSLAYVLSWAAPFALAAGFVIAAGALGVLGPAPRGAVAPPALPVDGRAVAGLAAAGLVFALGVLGRPWLLRTLTGEAAAGEDTPAALVLVVSAAGIVVWFVNPFAAALIALAPQLWLLAATPARRRPAVVAGLWLASVAPFALAFALELHALGLGPIEAARLVSALLAGGHTGPVAALVWSVCLGCAAAMPAVIRRGVPPLAAPAEVTVRGPLTYAGPGSLGGTESALRR